MFLQDGSTNVIEMHGTLPDNLILYEDTAPMYAVAKRIVWKLKYGDSYFIVVGTSFYTAISNELVKIARGEACKSRYYK